MKKIIVATWRLPVFHQHLTQAGYLYQLGIGMTAGTLVLTVHTKSLHDLNAVVARAHQECLEGQTDLAKRGILAKPNADETPSSSLLVAFEKLRGKAVRTNSELGLLDVFLGGASYCLTLLHAVEVGELSFDTMLEDLSLDYEATVDTRSDRT